MKKIFEKAWLENAAWLIFLIPLSWMYGLVIKLRRILYEKNILQRTEFDIPVIVVGNILAGGTGKTPAVIAFAEEWKAKNKKVGIISRGYGGISTHYPIEVEEDSDPAQVGDEPLLIKHMTGAVVVCDPDRVRGINFLVNAGCEVVLSDDGLQHYRLKPSRTLVVHPADWKGSTHLLPAGPFREPLNRLSAYDQVLLMDDTKRIFYCTDPEGNEIACSALPKHVNVVVGIAQPGRLLVYLDKCQITYTSRIFPDHYLFTANDFKNINGPILMTTKDWVKCQRLGLTKPVYVIGYRLT